MRLDEYNLDLYSQFADIVRSILKQAIDKATGLPRLQSTKARAKSADSLRAKLAQKCILDSDSIETQIKDLAGVRLIFYTNTDIDRFLQSRLIPETFDVDWKETRIHHPTAENENQRYQAIHYTISLSVKHASQQEYVQFKGMRCEIQLQTILDHAWAETSHDIVYKPNSIPGFGSQAIESLDKRMKKIMDDYLRPAGHEFQKIQHDYGRLLQGKELFDRGALETLERCRDNTERCEILSNLREYVIPNYDDLDGVYSDICRALLAAVRASHDTGSEPKESSSGTLAQKTHKDVASAVIDIFEYFRCVSVELTLQAMIELYREEQDEAIRKLILGASERLAKYNLAIWRKVGPGVQKVIAEALERLSPDELRPLRPLVLAVWRELVTPNLQASSFSAEQITMEMAAVPVNESLRAIRSSAITGLIGLFDASSSKSEKREAFVALEHAMRVPMRANYSNELHQLVLDNTRTIVELLTERVRGQPYELLADLESNFLFVFRNSHPIADAEEDRFGCRNSASALVESIARFRDLINSDQQYERYKTLVGFRSVLPPHWENDQFGYTGASTYRMQQVAAYVGDISEETTEEWSHLVITCAATKSDDLATFPVFNGFLQQVAKAKPSFTFALLKQENPDVMTFLPLLLSGLFEGEDHDGYSDLIGSYLERSAYLSSLGLHCRFIKAGAADTIQSVLSKSIAMDERLAVFECLLFAVENHDDKSFPLLKTLFAPALKHVTSANDARWINAAGSLLAGEAFFSNLPAEHVERVLDNLSLVAIVNNQAENVLAYLATHHAASVWSFLKQRFGHDRSPGEHYEPIPHQFFALAKVLGGDPKLAITTLRVWYGPGDRDFRFTGGRLLHSVFPTFTDGLADVLDTLVAGGSEDDEAFAISLLLNYEGEAPIHRVVKTLIDRIPDDDQKLKAVHECLGNTGVVSGNFGFVEAYRDKSDLISKWIEDPRPKVKSFALAYIKTVSQRIASEQRSADMEKELRKLHYEDL